MSVHSWWSYQKPAPTYETLYELCSGIKKGIPKFNDLISLLHNILENINSKSGSSARCVVCWVDLKDQSCSTMVSNCFEKCKRSFIHQVMLLHCDRLQCLRVYTDLCYLFWSGIVIQVPGTAWNVPKHCADQHHALLTVLPKIFFSAKLSLSTLH